MTLREVTHASGRRFHAQPTCLCEHEPVSHLAKDAVALQRVVHELMPSIVSHHRRLLDAPCLRRLAWEAAVRAQVIDEATLARAVQDVRVRGLCGVEADQGWQTARLTGAHHLEKHEAQAEQQCLRGHDAPRVSACRGRAIRPLGMIALHFLEDKRERVDATMALALTAPHEPMQAAEANIIVSQPCSCTCDGWSMGGSSK